MSISKRLKRVILGILLLSTVEAGSSQRFETAPRTLSGNAFAFQNESSKNTVVLVVRSEEDIKESFRAATALDTHSERLNYLIVADFSNKSIMEKLALKRASNRFFKSRISREHIAIEESDSLFAAFSSPRLCKTAIISSEKKILWESPEYLEDIERLIRRATLGARSP